MSMQWVELVTLAAIVQLFIFGGLVGNARRRYNVPPPAPTGHEMFDRYQRVHMNTLETMVVFLPALWIAAQYWRQEIVAPIGVVYLIGRQLYLSGYINEPKRRGLGYGLSILPTFALVVLAVIGIVRAWLAAGTVGAV